jgi:hypothetical protein
MNRPSRISVQVKAAFAFSAFEMCELEPWSELLVTSLLEEVEGKRRKE